MKKYYKDNLVSVIKSATPKPKFELTQSQIDKLKTAGNIVLALVGLSGILLMSVVAPNALQAFKFLGKKQSQRIPFDKRQRKLIRSFYYLKDKGYIELKPKKNRDFEINLTDKGKIKIRALKLETLQIKKPLVWDRKFWQVAADIPVEYRKGADALRKKLKQMGFYSLQRTLWFYPYDPREEIELLTEEYKIGQFVTVMKIAKLDPADYQVLFDFFKETGVVEF